ncbi:MAG: NAD(P)-dependent alcohol dehydrogenase [Bifidobacteriaceae bacterium]|jgi:L-iditol 2-dehydrogenase|nr:NAD(P)-dependent alcohol dehydrogenase [Bifidobacteriaceae bacterium]
MPQIPKTMRASVLKAQGDLALEDVPTPAPAPDQVVVKVGAVGICGSDVHYFKHGRIGDFVVDAPIILGHEAAGTIVEVGTGVDPGRIGQRVSIEPQRACRVCAQCKAGRYNLCPAMEFYATPPVDGAFSEYAVIQHDYAHPLPDAVSIEAGALCEPLSVGIWTALKAGIRPGSSVLIAGAGPIGVIMAQVARAYGASRVVSSDPIAQRRERATRLGATDAIDPAASDIAKLGLDVDVFIDAAGNEGAVRDGIMALGPNGRAVLVGMGADDMLLPVSRIQARELIVTGIFRYANTWPVAIDLVASGRVDMDALVTQTFGLSEVPAALTASGDPKNLKVVVYPDRA